MISQVFFPQHDNAVQPQQQTQQQQNSQEIMVSTLNRHLLHPSQPSSNPTYYTAQQQSVSLTNTPCMAPATPKSPSYEQNSIYPQEVIRPSSTINSIHTSGFLFQNPSQPQMALINSNPPSVNNSPLLNRTNVPSMSDSSVPSASQLEAEALENDPYFIPVQGVLPPSKNQDGRYECQLCDRSYTHAKHLKRHMMRHTGQKPYSCFWCSAKFTRPDIRKRHVSKCKVRRKMEGLESIKIEEEDPAKMIEKSKLKAAAKAKASSAGIKKPNPATKTKAAAKAAQKTVESASNTSTPLVNAKLFSKNQQQTNAVSAAMIQAQQIYPSPYLNEAAFDSSLLEASIKKELEDSTSVQVEPFYQNTPTLPHTVYVSAMPTPSIISSAISSPVIDMQRYYYQPIVNYGLYYENQQANQPPQMTVLTPQQYHSQRIAPDTFSAATGGVVYGESPLETFVPPVYH